MSDSDIPTTEPSTTDGLNLFADQDKHSRAFVKEGSDFIEQVSNYISATTKTGQRWADCIATELLSTVLGPDRFISDSKGKLRLNVWFMNIGPSGLATKTTPLKSYFVPILIRVGEKCEYPFLLPAKWSVESLIDYMGKHSLGCMYRDEFTGMLKESASKDYLTDSLEFLSELYDGTVQQRVTFAHGHTDIKQVYTTFITATTPYLYKILRSDFYTQGTGNRILHELFSEGDISDDELDPDKFFKGPKFEQERECFMDEVAEILIAIRNSSLQYLIPEEAACKMWTAYELQCRRDAKRLYKDNSYDIHYSYISRMPEMALKLAGLFTISRSWSTIILEGMPPQQIILERDMRRAIDKTRHHYQEFCRMLDQWRSRPEPAIAKTIDEQAAFVVDRIANGRQAKWSDLRRDSKWDDRTWLQVLKYLYDSEKIKIYYGKSTGGRKPILVSEANVEVDGQVFPDWRIIENVLNLR